ncbi:MAG: hypothetical protein IH840_12065, partial [Candidatus Heimdallarchaeota archaeon]|nr:hypothetical protein [Candidatus Heimdallarchaeota archaeon]
MKSKEKLAIDYIFFRFPSHYAIALVPVLGGIISVLSSKYNDEVISNNHWELTRLNQQLIIESYLFYSKFLLIFIISFYIAYRWTLMLRDGTYGFWLTQQVRRSFFFVHAIIRFTLEIFFGLTLGLALLYYPTGIVITFTDLLFLSSLLLVNVLL